MLKKRERKYRRHKRIRAKLFGTAKVPRLSVFRSAKHIYAQLIDDEKGVTLVAASDRELKKSKIPEGKPSASYVAGKNQKSKTQIKKIKIKEGQKLLTGKAAFAYEIGKLIAKKALEKKIEKVVFDRRGYKYHGRVKAVSEGAREGGLKF